RTEEDYDLLKCLRAHGWSREQSNRAELEREHRHIDPRFLFINVGYNLRPMEIQAAFGLQQLKRLNVMNAHRRAIV
ncbi:DegT/DnrJ/EryC1/StrS family aminotransferase, partial [Salmonella enterica]|uniref:DegT/DnrJ/EryC1/StrS family aminotransferase n=1 Tax=Salmonella enterica TaxID=28901 RepID=UPI003299BC44